MIKTVAGQFAALAATLRELHPYVVPEIIALPITEGLDDYLNWMMTCTQPDA
jgi:periplasmic divalent cation tolerance protein